MSSGLDPGVCFSRFRLIPHLVLNPALAMTPFYNEEMGNRAPCARSVCLLLHSITTIIRTTPAVADTKSNLAKCKASAFGKKEDRARQDQGDMIQSMLLAARTQV
jgi:hypothetical protein